jgi:hypothetical protein
MLAAALCCLGLTLLGATEAARHGLSLVIVPALFAVGFGSTYLSQRKAWTRIDENGIDAEILAGVRRRAGWAEIDDIRVVERSRNFVIVVKLESGKKFTLGAPSRGPLFPDPAFRAKSDQILDAWVLMCPDEEP